MKKSLALFVVFFLVASCTCGTPFRVSSIQKTDKKLTCKDIILEINESEHYREEASRERGIGMGEALMPICWATGFVDGSKALKAANSRINYLGHIYDLLDCGGKDYDEEGRPVKKQTPIPAPVAVPAPQPSQSVHRVEVINNYIPYRSTDTANFKTFMHEHSDKYGKPYIHSHMHKAPHKHAEDQP